MNQPVLALSAVLFALGLFGLATRRNVILLFLSMELMLVSVSLNFAAFAFAHQDLGGQVFVLMILTVAACEAALALALVVQLYRMRQSLDVQLWQSLGDPQSIRPAPIEDSTWPREPSKENDGPSLVPAGRDPAGYLASESIDSTAAVPRS